jgi:hypothetical protein
VPRDRDALNARDPTRSLVMGTVRGNAIDRALPADGSARLSQQPGSGSVDQ